MRTTCTDAWKKCLRCCLFMLDSACSRNDTSRRRAASGDDKIICEVHLHTNDFSHLLCIYTQPLAVTMWMHWMATMSVKKHALCKALRAYNMDMVEIHAFIRTIWSTLLQPLLHLKEKTQTQEQTPDLNQNKLHIKLFVAQVLYTIMVIIDPSPKPKSARPRDPDSDIDMFLFPKTQKLPDYRELERIQHMIKTLQHNIQVDWIQRRKWIMAFQ